jgi:hypothetical protein
VHARRRKKTGRYRFISIHGFLGGFQPPGKIAAAGLSFIGITFRSRAYFAI